MENSWENNINSYLVLQNDDVNTFEHVINSLVTACNHTYEQAEQCALFTHFKGSYDIKYGELRELQVLQSKLQNKGLNVVINTK